ncbi:hypothetical protein AGABI1DRAFT_77367 [Agaricus bisporus var. burnettii JB137-S8]|uniref:tRNA-dihydrouridine(16/17) synthase [NAD(P)(+)] n=1 Tax=Agaricus bisporus var. burnettii (strain JB137-S8 / ATCC MYA-4627 / FGSC 10392) TaxID=597362 RepID=K5X2H1_AGABU|nr:uncharacterized protein AGABI1DRAFT_77367 [Agaricus bisporus var. burnettii JB137-S8]EKM77358.1 hypothetical protein AGABI1DRAFT_77367 [Agaricus bisporus var. burnettii JB137-S8]
MLMSTKLLSDQEYLETHLKDLSTVVSGLENPVVAQLCGNDPDAIVQAGRKLQNYCQGIVDLNLGCPQGLARDGHYGAYLLGQSDWSLVELIVSSMAQSFTVPVSVKTRLCQPQVKTLELYQRLEHCGASWLILHGRTISARRRRQGSADLTEVKRLKENLSIPIISNGNVRGHNDIWENLAFTGADGLMVGETLLGNPCVFTETLPDPVDISFEYLSLCHQYPGIASLQAIQTHIRHFIEFQCGRETWFNKFRTALSATRSIEDIEHLVYLKLERWRGRKSRYLSDCWENQDKDSTSSSESDHSDLSAGDLDLLTMP